ncbi:MAG: rubrerythrin family protein [Terracidiphilus sp.]
MSVVAAENAITVQNLMAAFEAASNAHARYMTFAEQAEEDGFRGIASLFRSVARARQIHATHFAHVIDRAGGLAECEISLGALSGTLENLKAALNSEQHEIASVLPDYQSEAAGRGNTAALRSFTGAMEAEKAHARLFSAAIALLTAGKKVAAAESWIGEARDFYVCPVCGYTSETEEESEHCPVCRCGWEKFEIIR